MIDTVFNLVELPVRKDEKMFAHVARIYAQVWVEISWARTLCT